MDASRVEVSEGAQPVAGAAVGTLAAEVPKSGPADSVSHRWRWLRRARGQRLGILGVIVLLLVLGCAVLAPVLAPQEPIRQQLGQRLKPPGWSRGPGQPTHWLGTDQLGRDILSRVIYGSRISLIVGFVSVIIGGSFGLAAGLFSGYFRGPLDTITMRLLDLQLAFPFILLALAIVALLGATLRNIIIVFAITSWPLYARPVRAAVLSVKEKEYVEAARSMGNSTLPIIWRHVLPNVINPLIVIASFDVARLIINEAALGFLGLGVQPPTPTWGNMLADGRAYIRDSWWLAAFPGLAIMITAAGVNFIGDALRDLLDPRSQNW